eukprot:144679_1
MSRRSKQHIKRAHNWSAVQPKQSPWKINDISNKDKYIVFGYTREFELKSKKSIPFAVTNLCLQFHYNGPKDYFKTINVGHNILIEENKRTIIDTTCGCTNSCYGMQQIDGSILNVLHVWKFKIIKCFSHNVAIGMDIADEYILSDELSIASKRDKYFAKVSHNSYSYCSDATKGHQTHWTDFGLFWQNIILILVLYHLDTILLYLQEHFRTYLQILNIEWLCLYAM